MHTRLLSANEYFYRFYQQHLIISKFLTVNWLIIRTHPTSHEGREMTIAAFITILLKILSNPALIAGLIAFLQKSIHP